MASADIVKASDVSYGAQFKSHERFRHRGCCGTYSLQLCMVEQIDREKVGWKKLRATY